VKFGGSSFKYSGDVFFHFKAELNLVTEFPVLIAIDDYNCLFHPSEAFYDPDSKKFFPERIIPYKKLRLSTLLADWRSTGLLNGTVICTLSSTIVPTRTFFEKYKQIHGKHFLEVPPYTLEEFFIAMKNYKSAGYIQDLPKGNDLYLYHLTDGRPSDLLKYISHY